MEKSVNGPHELIADPPYVDAQESLTDEWVDLKPGELNADVVAEINIDHSDFDEEAKNEKELNREWIDLKPKRKRLSCLQVM